VGRIVPIYEAIGAISSRMIRRMIHASLENLASPPLDPLPADLLARHGFPSRSDALRFVHFSASRSVPRYPQPVPLSPAHRRLIFSGFLLLPVEPCLATPAGGPPRRQSLSRVRDPQIREAVKRILPFKPTAAQKRVLAEIAADLERPVPMHRLLEGDVGSGKTIVAFEAAAIVMKTAGRSR